MGAPGRAFNVVFLIINIILACRNVDLDNPGWAAANGALAGIFAVLILIDSQ